METNNKAIHFYSWNCFRNYFIIQSAIIFVLFSISLSFAGNVTFVKEYTYQASELDSKASCRTISLEMVKRLLLEELGTYLISETEVKDFKLTKEQVKTYSAGIVGAEIIEDKWDGKTYWLKAKVSADPKEVAKSIKSIGEDKQKKKELEEVRKKAKDALEEIERLKNELEIAKIDKKKIKKYNKTIKELSATDWYEKGLELGWQGKDQEEIEAMTMAIKLNPQFVWAYVVRGGLLIGLGKYKEAINDLDKAIEIDPSLAAAYTNRSSVYGILGNHQKKLKDLNKAVEVDPSYEYAYFNRGATYHNLGNYQQAINDYSKAIQLNPQDAHVYYNRGLAYYELNNAMKGVEDLKKSAELGLKSAQDFLREKGISW